jgi:hypothetical protein
MLGKPEEKWGADVETEKEKSKSSAKTTFAPAYFTVDLLIYFKKCHFKVSIRKESVYLAGNPVQVQYVHRKKRLATFPSPVGMSLTKLSLGGNNLII